MWYRTFSKYDQERQSHIETNTKDIGAEAWDSNSLSKFLHQPFIFLTHIVDEILVHSGILYVFSCIKVKIMHGDGDEQNFTLQLY